MTMTSYITSLTLITMCAYCACASPIICSIFCAHKVEFPGMSLNQNCDCPKTEAEDLMLLRGVLQKSSIRRNGSAELASGSTPAPTTTTDICDYLCSIQLGGEACQCSSPGLPGRKRK